MHVYVYTIYSYIHAIKCIQICIYIIFIYSNYVYMYVGAHRNYKLGHSNVLAPRNATAMVGKDRAVKGVVLENLPKSLKLQIQLQYIYIYVDRCIVY